MSAATTSLHKSLRNSMNDVGAASGSASGKPDNYAVNAKICGLVERHPCMYDRTNDFYLKKDIVEKAWAKISREMNESVSSCKERWRNIRTSFARSINVRKSGGYNRSKPYYLHDELRFLLNHITPGVPIPTRRSHNSTRNGSARLRSASMGRSRSVSTARSHPATMHDDSEDYNDEARLDVDGDDEEFLEEDDDDDVDNMEVRLGDDVVMMGGDEAPGGGGGGRLGGGGGGVNEVAANEGPVAAMNRAVADATTTSNADADCVVALNGAADCSARSIDYSQMPNLQQAPSRRSAIAARKRLSQLQMPPQGADEEEAHFDLMFLQSVLPDVRRMSRHQKLHFKQRLFEIILESYRIPKNPADELPPRRAYGDLAGGVAPPCVSVASSTTLAEPLRLDPRICGGLRLRANARPLPPPKQVMKVECEEEGVVVLSPM